MNYLGQALDEKAKMKKKCSFAYSPLLFSPPWNIGGTANERWIKVVTELYSLNLFVSSRFCFYLFLAVFHFRNAISMGERDDGKNLVWVWEYRFTPRQILTDELNFVSSHLVSCHFPHKVKSSHFHWAHPMFMWPIKFIFNVIRSRVWWISK